jgi:hypothetical protein
MPVYRTGPDGFPVLEGTEPEPEREPVPHGMSDHETPAMRQHVPEPARPADGPQAAPPGVPGPEAIDEKAARVAALRAELPALEPGA